MSFQFWSMSEDSSVGILLRGSSIWVCLVILNQGCCSIGQYNLCSLMLMYCLLPWLTLHIRARITISHLTIPGIVAHGKCYISHCFFNRLFCSACILQMHNKPYQFLIQIKVYFFLNLWLCPPFKWLLLLLYLLFLLLLIINISLHINIYIYIYILLVLFCYYFSLSLFSNAKISLVLLLPLSFLSIFQSLFLLSFLFIPFLLLLSSSLLILLLFLLLFLSLLLLSFIHLFFTFFPSD